MTTLQRICAKIYTEGPGPGPTADQIVPLFQRWIRERRFADLTMIDVADYAHVPDGPGVMLIAHEFNFGLDASDQRLGVLAQRKRGPELALDAAIAVTLQAAGRIGAELVKDGCLGGTRLALDTVRIEANDRLAAPNSEAGWARFGPALAQVATRIGAKGTRRIASDPRDRLAGEICGIPARTADELVGQLAGY